MDIMHRRADSPEAVRARFKRIRLMLGLSQAEMAQAVGLESQQHYQSVESGRLLPPYEVAVAIAEIYSIPLDYTLRGLPRFIPSEYFETLTRPYDPSEAEAEAGPDGKVKRKRKAKTAQA